MMLRIHLITHYQVIIKLILRIVLSLLSENLFPAKVLNKEASFVTEKFQLKF